VGASARWRTSGRSRKVSQCSSRSRHSRVAGEPDDRQPSLALDPEGQPGLGNGLTDPADHGVDIDTVPAGQLRQLVQPGDGEAELEPQLLHEAAVQRHCARLVEGDPEGQHDAFDLDGCEQQRRGELAVTERPVEAAEGDVERVRTGLLDRRASPVTQPVHRGPVQVTGIGGVDRRPPEEHVPPDIARECIGVPVALCHNGTREIVHRTDRDGATFLEEGRQGAELLARSEQRRLGHGGVHVEQLVAQGEVEQRVLPGLNPRGRGWPRRLAWRRRTTLGYAGARRPGAAHLLGCGVVLDHLDHAVRADPPCRER